MSAEAPRQAQIATSPSTVVWTDGSNFDGYIWIGMSLPTGYSNPTLFNSLNIQKLPQFVKVPIIGGQVDQSTFLFYNLDINPPGSTYVAYWFDNNNTLIGPTSGTATPFTVTSASVTLTAPTLTTPTFATPPVPQT